MKQEKFSNTELSNYFISWNSICYLFHGKTKYLSKTLIPTSTCDLKEDHYIN